MKEMTIKGMHFEVSRNLVQGKLPEIYKDDQK